MSVKKQVGKNLILNVLSLLSQILIGLWIIPYLVRYIGPIAFGYVPIATILTEYVSLITSAFNGAISRYIIIDLQRGDTENALVTFNTAIVSIVTLVLVQVPIAVIVLIKIDSILSIPIELRSDVMVLFVLSVLSFLLSVLSTSFSTSMYAKNRLDLIQANAIVRIVSRTVLVVAFFSVDSPRLMYVGVAEISSSFLVLCISIYYWKILTPELKIKIGLFKKSLFIEIIKMCVWLVINRVGALFFLKVDLLIINRFLGALAGGQYAIANKWQELVRKCVGVLSNLSGPLVMESYANKQYDKMVRLLNMNMIAIALFVSVLSGIIAAWSDILLTLWVGAEYMHLSPILMVSVLHLPMNLSVLPLFGVQTVLKKVKVPGIMTGVAGVCNLSLALILVVVYDYGMLGVSIASMVVLTLKNSVFTALYGAKITELHWHRFLKPIYLALVFTTIVYGVAWGVRAVIDIANIYILIVAGAITVIVALIPLLGIVLLIEEKKELAHLLPNKLKQRFVK